MKRLAISMLITLLIVAACYGFVSLVVAFPVILLFISGLIFCSAILSAVYDTVSEYGD